MKLFNNLSLLITSLFILSSCDPFEGLLKVGKKFTMISTETKTVCDGFDCTTLKPVPVAIGEYKADFEFQRKDQAYIKLTSLQNGKKNYIYLNLPANLNLPKENGNFLIAANDLQQSFAISGSLSTQKTISEIQDGYERCTYTKYVTECNYINGQHVCRDVPYQYQGQRYAEFYTEKTEQNLVLQFIEDNPVANFTGSRESNQKIYTYTGVCL